MTTYPSAPRRFIGFIRRVRGGYAALDACGRRLDVAPTIQAARDLILHWHRHVRRGALILVESDAA